MSTELPLIETRGSPYDRGFQHGRAAGRPIRRYPDVLRETLQLEAGWRALGSANRLPTRDEMLERAMRFLPSIDAFAPHLVEEVRGIAAGACVSFAERSS